jgi:hypothetical protein
MKSIQNRKRNFSITKVPQAESVIIAPGISLEVTTMRTLLILVAGISLSAGLTCLAPTPSVAADTPEYSIFHSQPDRLEALLWAIVDCYPYKNLDEAKREYLRLANGRTENPAAALWPDEKKLAALEGEYGDMPEYWQARYFFNWRQADRGDVEPLRTARRLAPDNPAGMYFLADALLQQAVDMQEEEGASADQKATQPLIIEAAELMNQAASSEPRNAFYFYEAVRAEYKLGHTEKVLELLRQGNAAPINEVAQLFPVSYILRNMREIRANDDGSGKFHLLTFDLVSMPVPSLAERRNMLKELAAGLADSRDVELLNTLHIYACRFGEERYASLIQVLIASGLVNLLSTAAIDDKIISTDSDTLKMLGGMYLARGSITGIVKSYNVWGQYIQDEGLLQGSLFLQTESVTSPEDEWEQFMVLWQTIMAESLYISVAVADEFRGLERYRYHENGTITRESTENSS